MNKEVKIIIGSQVGSGKSTIAKVVYDALLEKGFVIEFKDDDVAIDDKFFDKDFQDKRIESINGDTLVKIETRDLRRNMEEEYKNE